MSARIPHSEFQIPNCDGPSTVTISRCRAGEVGDVVRFIDAYWERGHVLATCSALLDWQHRDDDGQGYSFVVARRRGTGEVLGILGYIPTRRFDASLAGDNVIWLTMWKVRADAGFAGLGLLLVEYLTRAEPHVAIGAIGLNPETIPIYRALGFRAGELHHYARASNSLARIEIATLATRPRAPAPGRLLHARCVTRDSEWPQLELVSNHLRLPRKSVEYFRNRYVRHPFYSYTVIAVLEGDACSGLIAARIAEHGGRRVLRVVDFAGSDEVLACSGPVIQQLLDDTGAEYADIYNSGIDAEVFARAGFAAIDPDGPDIVPDHFEPFERRNVRLWFSLKGPGDAALFKGDSDQDRPNRLSR